MISCSCSSRSITGASSGSLRSQVGEDAAVLERVVVGDDAAISLAERAERPVVLADRHPVEERAHRGRRRSSPRRDLLDQVAQAGRARRAGVVDVDQMPAGGLLARRVAAVRIRRGAGRPRRHSSHARSALRRRTGVGRRRGGERRRHSMHDRAGAGARRRDPALPRSVSTCSRTAGATSSAKRRTSSAEDDREDVGAHPGGQRELGELLGPVRGEPSGTRCRAEAAVDVEQPADLRGPAAGLLGRRRRSRAFIAGSRSSST